MQTRESAAQYKAKKVHTYQDYLELPDDRNRYEIIEGELIMSPSPTTIHQKVSLNIEVAIQSHLEKNAQGELFHAPCDVKLSETNVVQPDIFFISNENKKIIADDNIQGAPDLIIEILSPSSAYYDLVEKKELYEKFGVKEYWIVDPKKHWAEIYVLKKGKYVLHQRAEKSASLRSTVLKGFEVTLKTILHNSLT